MTGRAAMIALAPAVDPQQYEHDDAPDADLVGPDDPGRARRLTWSELLRRVWDH